MIENDMSKVKYAIKKYWIQILLGNNLYSNKRYNFGKMYTSSEMRLGVFFVSESDLEYNDAEGPNAPEEEVGIACK